MNASTAHVLALLAYSVHEHQAGTAARVGLTLRPGSCIVEDNGRGMGLDREGYVVGLMEQLVSRRTEVALHGIGLAIIAMASPGFSIEARRNGHLSTQTFAWGVAQGAVVSEPAEGATGTRVTLALAPDAPEVDVDQVWSQITLWRQAHPGLVIDVCQEA